MESFDFSGVGQSSFVGRSIGDIKHSEVVHLDEVGPAVLERKVIELAFLNVCLDESLSRESSQMLPKHRM